MEVAVREQPPTWSVAHFCNMAEAGPLKRLRVEIARRRSFIVLSSRADDYGLEELEASDNTADDIYRLCTGRDSEEASQKVVFVPTCLPFTERS